jgi:hypothetical protein
MTPHAVREIKKKKKKTYYPLSLLLSPSPLFTSQILIAHTAAPILDLDLDPTVQDPSRIQVPVLPQIVGLGGGDKDRGMI